MRAWFPRWSTVLPRLGQSSFPYLAASQNGVGEILKIPRSLSLLHAVGTFLPLSANLGATTGVVQGRLRTSSVGTVDQESAVMRVRESPSLIPSPCSNVVRTFLSAVAKAVSLG